MRTAQDVAALSGWGAEWAGLRVAVLGLGVTGFSVADTLAELGAELVVLSNRADEKTADLLDVIGVLLVLDSLDAELAAFAPDLVVVSPGFPPSNSLVAWATGQGIPVWGDIELAWRLRDRSGRLAEWIAVTGTNGKTTTVQLTTAMLAAGGKRVIACGNVGVPVLDAIRDPEGFDTLVVELSSFQLHYLDSMSAWASVCLNLADDHLDWHGSPEAYSSAKAKVYGHTKVACVYNLEDDATREMVEQAEVVEGCRAIGFGLVLPGPSDVGLVDEIVVDRAFHVDRQRAAIELTTVRELERVGLGSPHMIANVLAAAALARSVEISPQDIRSALRDFRLDHHRTETVAESGGVRWVNDSKATNPHAAQAALASFESVVWVVGGLLKGVDVNELVAANASRLRGAVVIGVDRQPLVEAFTRHAPTLPVFEVETADTKEVMPMAVRLSAAVAHSGDTVLLAPAAASMDQFTDYADRGNRFAEAVQMIMGGANDDQPAAPESDD
ncbi:UDP-N-acetylmuramoyl-L-alanine--D-glutamate ligase [Glaciihabitans sp. UYNi722]|uniref:UDP-N-acetylmuramoyl-L-alanine--D-glutamate ligase n=1 Tax=Glaciihabitans sp. UYNi722 TaxID=3156344 RepID=UPI0033952F98